MNLSDLLANMKVAPLGDDKIIWPHDSKGNFTIKSFYREVCVGTYFYKVRGALRHSVLKCEAPGEGARIMDARRTSIKKI